MKKILVSAFLTLSLAACGKPVPASTKPVIEAIRPDAEKVAVAAAAACAAQFASGRFVVSGKGCELKLLPGETIVPELPSPAKGTPLETNASVVDVTVMCSAATCGMGLGSLRKPATRQEWNGAIDHAESTCKEHADNCSEVIIPSRYSKAPDSVDLRLVRPVSGGPPGATAETIVSIAKK